MADQWPTGGRPEADQWPTKSARADTEDFKIARFSRLTAGHEKCFAACHNHSRRTGQLRRGPLDRNKYLLAFRRSFFNDYDSSPPRPRVRSRAHDAFRDPRLCG